MDELDVESEEQLLEMNRKTIKKFNPKLGEILDKYQKGAVKEENVDESPAQED